MYIPPQSWHPTAYIIVDDEMLACLDTLQTQGLGPGSGIDGDTDLFAALQDGRYSNPGTRKRWYWVWSLFISTKLVDVTFL